MQAKIQKWGNSLALRIPQSFAREIRLKSGSSVDLTLDKGKLVIDPVQRLEYDLDALLRKVSARNIHREVETGAPQGKEVW
jgi:antitoxin MazE